jgi:hypothetical protein
MTKQKQKPMKKKKTPCHLEPKLTAPPAIAKRRTGREISTENAPILPGDFSLWSK